MYGRYWMMCEPSITISVRLYGMLRTYRPTTAAGLPHNPFSLTVPTETTLARLLDHLDIPDGFVTAAAVNNTAVSDPLTTINLHPNDQVSLFPPSAGG